MESLKIKYVKPKLLHKEKLKWTIQTANSKSRTTINSLKNNQRAEQTRKTQIWKNYKIVLTRLISVDIWDQELVAQEELQNWDRQDTAIGAPK